jgi:arylsulfatase A-like enzyme
MADGVGHRYGPFSHEVMEMFLSLDSYLGAFFRYLDIKVGLEHVLIALTADHGAGYLPEYAQELGLGGGRYGGEAKKLLERLNRVLFDRFGAEKIVETASAGALFYDLHLLHEKGLQASDIDRVISPILKESEWIEDVIPSAVLESNQALTPLEERYRNIHHPTSSGDLYYMPKRHWISKSPYGASHGTPYDWDSHVPMVFAGNRIQGNTVSKRIMTIDLAPTLAARLGLEIPSNVDGKPLELGTIDSN